MVELLRYVRLSPSRKSASKIIIYLMSKDSERMDDVPGIAVELFALKTAASATGGRPLRGWKSVRLYERLVNEGYVQEVKDDSPFHRKFVITDAGRDVLARRSKTNTRGKQ
jgi:hypothetical protein